LKTPAVCADEVMVAVTPPAVYPPDVLSSVALAAVVSVETTGAVLDRIIFHESEPTFAPSTMISVAFWYPT
jgi:hypothetical protein